MSLEYDDRDEAALCVTLIAEIEPEARPELLLELVREKHPDATRQEIVHAAFRGVIELAYLYDYRRALWLQQFAFAARSL